MKKLIISILSVMMTLLCLSGCSAPKTNIAYTVYPLGYIAQRIAGNKLTFTQVQDNAIVQRAVANDDIVSTLDDSLVLLHIGALEPYLAVYSDTIKSSKIYNLDLSSMNAVYEFKRYTPVVAEGVQTFIESSYYNDPAFDEIDVNTRDLHLWIDPIAMLSMAKDVKNYLSGVFPEDASYFDDNFTSLETELVELDAQYQNFSTSLINKKQEIKFVSMTASFGNWQKAYGFQVYPVILSMYGILPTEEQLNVIKERIIADNVKYIAYEPNMTEDMIVLYNQLKDELDLTEVQLSNISSLTNSQRDNNKDYISIMYENLTVLETMATDIVVPVTEEETDEIISEEEKEEDTSGTIDNTKPNE